MLVNSNPATIMTDTDMADHVYIEPLTAEVVERIIEKEKPDAILPNLGGQTGLNLSMELATQRLPGPQTVSACWPAKPDTIDQAPRTASCSRTRWRRCGQPMHPLQGRGRPWTTHWTLPRSSATRSSSALLLPWAAPAAASAEDRGEAA